MSLQRDVAVQVCLFIHEQNPQSSAEGSAARARLPGAELVLEPELFVEKQPLPGPLRIPQAISHHRRVVASRTILSVSGCRLQALLFCLHVNNGLFAFTFTLVPGRGQGPGATRRSSRLMGGKLSPALKCQRASAAERHEHSCCGILRLQLAVLPP